MNRHSILFKIILFFVVALIATTALFKVMYDHEFTSIREQLRVHYHHVAMNIMRWKFGGGDYEQMVEALRKDKIAVVDDSSLYEQIRQRPRFDTVSCAKGDFHLYEKDGYRYMIAPSSVGEMLLKDMHTEPVDVNYVWWLYAGFILIMLLLFLSIAVSLYPLKQLLGKIKLFGEGRMDIDFSSRRKDEIANVSNEFDKAVKKLKGVMKARMIFLRNVTHELKTPVTTGKMAMEFIEDTRAKEILNNVFTRLELLLKEFTRIEQHTATQQMAERNNYHLKDILDQAEDLLFLESNSVDNNFRDEEVYVNFELFAIVFKNLIDNGIKYSEDKKVFLQYDDGKIVCCSKGKELEESLEYYIQPFTTCGADNSDSFGLGLYIVDSIVRNHGFDLRYEYRDGNNCFIIDLNTY